MFQFLDSPHLIDEAGNFHVSVDSFDKDVIFSDERKDDLRYIKHHPLYLYFGLLNSLNSKYGGGMHKHKQFFNIQDVSEGKYLKYALSPNLEMHLLFVILYNMFIPSEPVESFAALYNLINNSQEALFDQCKSLVLASREKWFNSKNLKIAQAALR